jgi:hypothetical protein
MRYVRIALLVTLLVLFGVWFQPYTRQWLVDALWLTAVAIWVFEVKQLATKPLFGFRVSRQDVVPIALLVVVFVCAWLPFYDNWRWAYTGDSLGEFGAPINFPGTNQDILSIHGIDDTVTWLHILTYNCLLFVFGPTFFWHRAGKLMISCVSLAAIYAYFAVVLGRWWALVLAFCVVTNYVWLWFSFVSYEFIDSYIFYFLSLTLGQLIWWRPERLGLWMLCGLVAGLAVFYAQPAWSGVAAVGLFLGIFALGTRRFAALAVCGLSFLLVALPIFLQGMPGSRAVANANLDWNYLRSIFLQILRLPYSSGFRHIGILDGFLRPPLDRLYVVGVIAAGLAVVPPIRRLLRLPPVAPVLFALFFWDVALLTLTNNGYGGPSSKRSYNLIPLQIFFGLLPIYMVYAWCKGQRVLRGLATAGTAIAVCVYAAGSFAVILYPTPGLYGSNSFDGLIELRQRFPERKVVFLTSREVYPRSLTPESFFNMAYHLPDQVTAESDFGDTTLAQACAADSILCTEPGYEPDRFSRLSRNDGGFTRFKLLNSTSLACFECSGPLR